jgi:C4-dicarboxylate-specific signal transduction histidine kinase
LILYYGPKNFITALRVLIRDRYKIRELDDLAISVNNMMDAVTSREESLRMLNETLEQKVRERTDAHEKTLETLQNARNQLLLTEKMAALGSLVSGVAHEINTPRSIGVTAASFLNGRINNIYHDWDSQVLTQENLERFLKDSDEASSIVQNNLDHAAKILNSLKQVAVDQQLDERREFELGSNINDILLSLKHQLRLGKHQMNANPDGVILVYTSPGAIIQILNNLVFTSITHGFSQKEGGRINISSRVGSDEVIMVYEDNGRGHSNEEYERIFGLYCTTRRGTGGSDLGMNIVFNLVTEKLNGQIEITLPANGGSGFTIRFPKITGGDI